MGCSVLAIYASYLIHHIIFHTYEQGWLLREWGVSFASLRLSILNHIPELSKPFDILEGGVLFFALMRHEYIGGSGSEFNKRS